MSANNVSRPGRTPVGLCAAAAVVLAALACPAAAGAKEISRKPFQHTVKDGSCNDTTCVLDMYRVGRGKHVEVQDVSCWIAVWTDGAVYRVSLRNDRTGEEDYLVPVKTMDDASTPVFAARAQTKFVAEARQRIRIEVQSRGNDVAALACRIAGDVVKLR